MPIEVISANEFFGYSIDSGDDVFLLAGVTVSNDGDAISDNAGSIADLFIYGSVFGAFRGVSINELTTFRATIGSTGVVAGASGGFIFSGDTLHLSNAGEISSSGEAFGHNAGSLTSLINTGLIHSANDSGIFNSSALLRLTNSGTISGRGTSFDETIEVVGQLIMTNSGSILSSAGYAIGTGLQDDIVRNSGFIDGIVQLNAGADRYIAIGDGVATGTIFGEAGNDTLIGGGLADVIDGGGAGDLIRGRDGDDELIGGNGNDDISGGADSDTITGGLNNDTLRGEDGNDNISGGSQDDRLVGGNGDDTLAGDSGADLLIGGEGADVTFGGNGNDTIFGNGHDDALNGGGDDDQIFGQLGNDTLNGDLGDDTLRGGAGEDEINGGAGRDLMFGEAGADAFVFDDIGEIGIGSARDVIRDFEQGTDVIDLFAMVPGALDFVGTGGFTGGGTASLRYVVAATGVVLQIDADGNGSRDGEIFVSDLTAVTADDFVL